jgi:long-chain acyl-CoA synthetase
VGIFDDRGRPVEQGESGEMWVRGPAVSTGYVNMPNQSADAFSDGWYHTSDLVRQDDQGFFHFVGRKHDMLKVGGIRVYPLEIEQVLVTHVDIAEAVVVRAVERVRGEVPRAVIRLEEGSSLSAKQVRAFCREHMAVYKAPRIVEFWDEIPKLPNGKVDRRKITATT